MTDLLPLTIEGVVKHGNHLGTGIDMPTANLNLDEEIHGLPFGVYYSKVYISDSVYKGITNVGKKPTVNSGDSVNAETFIYDFEGDLYDKEIKVELLEFRRPERKFSSFEELSVEMHKDLAAGRDYKG